MKFKELRENEPLKVIEVSRHVKRPTFNREITLSSDIIEVKQIQMKIFTDGEIEKESEEISLNIDEYYICKKKYQYDVDTLKNKKLYFKNHSYVITFLIASELMNVGKVGGWFDVVKEVSIHLQNPKDKKALKSAKQVIREIENCNKSIDSSYLFRMLFSQDKELEKFEIDKISKNVYSLKKNKIN